MTRVAIDIAMDTFDVAMEVKGVHKRASFGNHGRGRNDFHRWLKKHGVTEPHLFLEATGRYGESLATWAHDHGWLVTMINPRRTRKFAESEGLYNKTDRIDADCILQFAASPKARNLRLWQPRSKAETELREIKMELLGLEKMIVQERNRSKSCIATPLIKRCIAQNIAYLKEQKKLLERRALEVIKGDKKLQQLYKILIKVKGFGPKTVITMLARVDFDQFKKGRQLVGFAGLAPRKWESGKSVCKKEIISRVGHADLRCALFFPAIVAMTHDAETVAYKEKLQKEGKPTKVIICAVMARLLRKAFALVRDARCTQSALAA